MADRSSSDPRQAYPAVESMPEDGGDVEENGLTKQYERYPLVIGNHLSVVVSSRQWCIPRQVVRVSDPAVVGRVLAVWSGEVFRCPAGDRIADVLVHADKDGEHHQHDDRVARTQSINKVVVV